MTSRHPAAQDTDGVIRSRLLQPASDLSIPELAGLWFTQRTDARIAGYGKLASDPGLPGRLRGAFGTALVAGASRASLDGLPCTYDPPSAFEVLFRKQGRMMSGLDFPSPWVIGVAPRGADLIVSLTLFGFACDWAAGAVEAFTRAVTELAEWNSKPPVFLPKIEVISRTSKTVTGLVWPEFSGAVEIEFISPVVVTDRDPRERPQGLITGLGTRVSGLARWHDVSTDTQPDWKGLRAQAAGLQFAFESPESIRWQRGSRRQDRTIPMSGLLGRLLISGDLGQLAPLLAIGETCHMGADVALGCGRYRILGWN